jgi:hypothetical protein
MCGGVYYAALKGGRKKEEGRRMKLRAPGSGDLGPDLFSSFLFLP